MSGIKPENSFSALSPLSPTVARCARHSHPSRPKKKPLRGKKVGSAEKKLRLTQKMAHRVYQGDMSLPVGICHDRPSRGSWLWLRRAPSCASGFAFRLLRVAHNMPSPMATCSPSHLSHPTFCSLPPHSSHHPYKPHQIKQSLSKRGVNKRTVGKRQSFLQNRWLGYLLYCKL